MVDDVLLVYAIVASELCSAAFVASRLCSAALGTNSGGCLASVCNAYFSLSLSL